MNIDPPPKDSTSMPFSSDNVGEDIQNANSISNETPRITCDITKLEKQQQTTAIDNVEKTASSSTSKTDKTEVKKKRRKKKWKKPKDKPNRPLSAYNLFFQSERATMLGDDAPSYEDELIKKRVHCKTHGKIGFAEMAKAIGNKWKNLDPDSKKVYEMRAQKEKQRYAVDLANWKEAQKAKDSAEEEKMMHNDLVDPLFGGGAAAATTAATAMMDRGRGGTSSLTSPIAAHQQQQSNTLRGLTQMADERRNLALLQQHRSQEIPLDYLRALQEQRQMDHTALLGRSQLDAPQLLEYPSAAEASANAILQQFQSGQQHQQQTQQQQGVGGPQHQTQAAAAASQLSQQSSQQLLSSSRDLDQQLQSLANRYPNVAAAAAVRRIQQQYLAGDYSNYTTGGSEFPFNIR